MRIAKRRHALAVLFLIAWPIVSGVSGPIPTAAARSITCDGLEATIVGTAGRDILTGTPGDDVIHGLDANDTIRGMGGNDVICGGKGHDHLIGGTGNDVLLGGPGRDIINGSRGDDRLYGHQGNDILQGGAGADLLSGGSGGDVLRGQQGADDLRGGAGDEVLQGGGNHDVLTGHPGNDTLDGGVGDDDLTGGPGTDSCIGGIGTDRAETCEDIESTERGQRPGGGLAPRPDAVALTFDDGPHPWYTPKVLDILDRYHVKATFFVLGVQAQRYPELVAEIARRGHSVQNHTCAHLDLTRYSYVSVLEEIRCGSDWIEKLTGSRPTCFRPPYGAMSSGVIAAARELGEPPVLWTIDTQDYSRPGSTTIARRALAAGGGDTVLMHDAGGYRDQTVAALPSIIEGLRARGLEFDTLCG